MPRKSKTNRILNSWSSLFIYTIIAGLVYIFMEWLFFITKPSSLSILTFSQKIEVLLFSSSLIAVVCILFLLILVLLGLIPWLSNYHEVFIKLGAFLPAGILASMILLMVDNFTYTIFHFGIVTSKGIVRGLYAVGYLVVLGYGHRHIVKILPIVSRFLRKRDLEKTALILLTGSIVILFLIPLSSNDFNIKAGENETAQLLENYPYIFFITGDGVNAASMSVYGYERDTTPHLRELADTSLVAENAFANSSSTPGSLISALTGKYPTSTRVLYPPDILKEEDAYQHLPGILRAQGYYTVQMSVPHYGDAYTLNLLDGFDEANGRTMKIRNRLLRINKFIPADFAYFIYEISNRLFDRLKHIFYINVMENPYDLVMKPPDNMVDQTKTDNTKKLIRKSKKPLFIHIHFMVTHGPKFSPQQQVFSLGQDIETQEEWNTDFYDDSILSFDKQIGDIIDILKKFDLFDKSIIIISSDHGQKHIGWKRIPLIIHFPKGQYAGRIESNVQSIDIAPTILDFLGLEKPVWMPGNSLLVNDISQRPIYIINNSDVERDETGYFVVKTQDKYFEHIGKIGLVYCQKWYSIDLQLFKLESGNVDDYSAPCQERSIITNAEAFRLILNHLKENGFDVSSLEDQYEKIVPQENYP